MPSAAEMNAIARRKEALRLAIESYGADKAPSEAYTQRAAKFEAYLWPVSTSPHHPCREPECATPSGKIACHTCGEAWPCSRSSQS